MDGSELEVKKLRVEASARGHFLHLTTPDGKTLAPIRIYGGIAKDIAYAAIRATPTEKI